MNIEAENRRRKEALLKEYDILDRKAEVHVLTQEEKRK